MPTVAASKPGSASRSRSATGMPCPLAWTQACVAAMAWATISARIARPPTPCQRAKRFAPIPRSSAGVRDINTSMTATPYPASRPVTWARSGGSSRSGMGMFWNASSVTMSAP